MSQTIAPTMSPTMAPTMSPNWHNIENRALRMNDRGDIECLSLDGTNCLSNNQGTGSYDGNIDRYGRDSKLVPLACGEDHKIKFGITGYDSPEHWCTKARNQLDPKMRPTMAPTMAPTMRPTISPTIAPTIAPIDPRSNLTEVIRSIQPYSDNTNYDVNYVITKWPNLIKLVKSITGGKPVSLCVDPPPMNGLLWSISGDTTSFTGNSGPYMETLGKNIYYVTKNALNIAAKNAVTKGNFYDIAALLCEMNKFGLLIVGFNSKNMKVIYDNNNMISAVTFNGQTLTYFLKIKKQISVPLPSQLGNDPDLISFVETMIPLYNSFIPTLSQMLVQSDTVDANTFSKMITCVNVLFLTTFIKIPPFECTSNQTY
jgi:hypothetical protein